jgi:hypothetical protein
MGVTSRLITLLFLSAAATAGAATNAPVAIGERWSVVGVIAGDPLPYQAPTGIAVLRNNVTQRSYTLTIGDPIPSEFGFTLKNVLSRSVVIAKGDESVTLGFAEPAAETPSDDAGSSFGSYGPVDRHSERQDQPSARVSRFLETYNQSFDNVEPLADDFSIEESDTGMMIIPRLNSQRNGRGNRLGILQGPLLQLDDDEDFD